MRRLLVALAIVVVCMIAIPASASAKPGRFERSGCHQVAKGLLGNPPVGARVNRETANGMRLLGRSPDRTIVTLVTELDALPDDRFSTLSFVPILRWCHRHFRNDAHTNAAYELLRAFWKNDMH